MHLPEKLADHVQHDGGRCDTDKATAAVSQVSLSLSAFIKDHKSPDIKGTGTTHIKGCVWVHLAQVGPSAVWHCLRTCPQRRSAQHLAHRAPCFPHGLLSHDADKFPASKCAFLLTEPSRKPHTYFNS